MKSDGKALFAKFAALVLAGWLCAMPFIGWFAGLVLLAVILFVLHQVRQFYTQLERRDNEDDLDELNEGLGHVGQPRSPTSSNLIQEEAPAMYEKLTQLLGRLLGGTTREMPQKTGGLAIPDARSGKAGLPVPLKTNVPAPDDIIDVLSTFVGSRRGTARPPTRRPEPGPLSRPHPTISGRMMSIADLAGQIEVSSNYEEEATAGPLVDVSIVYAPHECSGYGLRQQQLRVYQWRCSGSSDAEIIRKVTNAWSSYMNNKHNERALELGDVVIIDGRHYIIDRIGPQLVSYDEAEAWIRLEHMYRRQGFELARKHGYI